MEKELKETRMTLKGVISKLRKEQARLMGQLEPIAAAIKALDSANGRVARHARKRVLSAAGRARMSRAAKKRWKAHRAKARKQKTA